MTSVCLLKGEVRCSRSLAEVDVFLRLKIFSMTVLGVLNSMSYLSGVPGTEIWAVYVGAFG